MENYRVHPFMQNKNGYEMILETVPNGTVLLYTSLTTLAPLKTAVFLGDVRKIRLQLSGGAKSDCN